jgi:ATP-dependent DNA ligase
MQSICMSLPDYGVHFQETVSGFAIFNVFDIPQYKTTDVSGKTLQERKDLLQEVQFQLWRSEWDYIEFTKYFYGNEINFSELLTEIWDNGGEGLMLKKLDSPYLQKKSKLWLKVKAAKTYDVVICGYQEPTKEYTGSELETWQYWENDLTDLSKDPTPVTKPYAMGWIGAIEFGVYRDNQLIRIGKCADFTEEDLEYIKANKDRLIGTCIEVKANGMIDPEKRSLRHPVFNRFRPDKSPNECTWDSLEE